MKFSTDKAHRDYFYKHGTIEFDGLFSGEQVNELNQLVVSILSKNLGILQHNLDKQATEDLYKVSHDLWRKEEAIQKILLHRRLAEIAVELMEVRSLRMGFDQLLISESKKLGMDQNNPYYHYLRQNGTLQERSSLTPTICGLMICLEPVKSSAEPAVLFSQKAGSGVFFKADIPMDLGYLTYTEGCRYLLLTFVDPRTVYVLNEQDPHTHFLKKLGFVFGDRLTDKSNPLLYR